MHVACKMKKKQIMQENANETAKEKCKIEKIIADLGYF